MVKVDPHILPRRWTRPPDLGQLSLIFTQSIATAMNFVRGLRRRNIRGEKVSQRGQFFDLLRRIAGLRNEKDRKNGPLWCFRSRNTLYDAGPLDLTSVIRAHTQHQQSLVKYAG